MAIPFKRYVDITSGVGGNGGVPTRELIGRIFTINPLLPPASFVEFSDVAEVGSYFGTTSDEYRRAAFYFGYVSKNIVRPKKISFARWVDAAVEPRIYGAPSAQALASWTSITSGSFSLTLGAFTNAFTGLNFSGAASLSAVAAIIQAAVRTYSAGGALFTAATVTYDATRQSFNLVGGATGVAAIAVASGGGSDIASQLGWLSLDTILAAGAVAETITTTLTSSADASDNFGSFAFIPTLNLTQITDAAIWCNGENVKYQYMVPVSAANASAYSAALAAYAGVAITLSPLSTEYPEMVPMIILASTAYHKRNSTVNYMFKDFALTPSVTSGSVATTLDNLNVNYYGVTQTAGVYRSFYQRGILQGLSTAPRAMNVYANEQWLKDHAGAQIMGLLLALAKISANAQGAAQLRTILQGTINLALFNGTISIGKPLDDIQKAFVANITGDDLAWHQVQNDGYWLDVSLQSYVTAGGVTEWKALYTLVYSKDDAVNKVEGTHILI